MDSVRRVVARVILRSSRLTEGRWACASIRQGNTKEPIISSSSSTIRLSEKDVEALRDLKGDLFLICRKAKERGVPLAIDAEYSWYQVSLFSNDTSLLYSFNRVGMKHMEI